MHKRLTSSTFALFFAICFVATIVGSVLAQQTGDQKSKWKVLADIPSPQIGCAAAVVDKKLHILGGAAPDGGPTDAHQVYDPVTNTWTTKAPIPEKVGWMAIAVYKDKIYIFGGHKRYQQEDYEQTDRAYCYDRAKDRWTELKRLPALRSSAAARPVGDYIYIFGCRTLKTDIPDLSTYRYDPRKNTYARLANMPEGARFMTQAAYNGFIYVVHGETAQLQYADGVLKYDIKKDVWTKLNIARPIKTRWTLSQHSANISIGSKLFILGGMPPEGVRTPMATYFDMATESFGMADPMPAGRCCGASGIIDGTIYSAGGFWQRVADVTACRETWAYPIPKALTVNHSEGKACCTQ